MTLCTYDNYVQLPAWLSVTLHMVMMMLMITTTAMTTMTMVVVNSYK